MQYGYQKIKMFVILCISFVCLSGCSSQKNKEAVTPDKSPVSDQEAEISNADQNMPASPTEENEDMVPSPIDFHQSKTIRKIEENDISYYNYQTAKKGPLPLNEWAKLNIAADNGTAVCAYLQFTGFTKDTNEITEHMKQYSENRHTASAFDPQPLIDGDEYVLMHYSVLVGKDTDLKGDRLSLSALRFPIQLYSTTRNGVLGDGTVSERENSVTDVSLMDTDFSLTFGTAIEKSILCSVPKDDTAYGIAVLYQDANGTTQPVYFKLDYPK